MGTFLILVFIGVLIWYIIKNNSSPELPMPYKPPEPVTLKINTQPTFRGDFPAEKDAWEDLDADLYGPGQRMRHLSGVRLNIHFTDKEGKRTQRDVTTQRYSYNPDTKVGVLYAFCHMRNGNRPFALNRINNAVDLETGEIIPDMGIFLEAAFERTPQFAVEQFLSEHDAATFVLFSFAKADGAMRAKERAILLTWAKAQGLQESEALAELEARLGDWYMTRHAFWDAVKSVNKIDRSEEYMRTLWKAAVAIVMSDKKPHDQERQFLRYAAEKWGIQAQEVPDLDDTTK